MCPSIYRLSEDLFYIQNSDPIMLLLTLRAADGTSKNTLPINCTGSFGVYFHRIGPLGRFGLVVAMSLCLSDVPFPCNFFKLLKSKWFIVEGGYLLILMSSNIHI